jgi:hypothetical protein
MGKEELEKKIDQLMDEVDEIREQSFNKPDGWKWYINHPKMKELIKLEREYKLIEDYTLNDICGGDLMTISDFIEGCKVGPLFTDYDGFGYYATKDKESDITVYPSDIMSGVYRKDFTHVVWYNK